MGLSYWNSAAPSLVRGSLHEFAAQNEAERFEMLGRYGDYYEGNPVTLTQLKYFPKRHRETQLRYDDRTKVSLPFCRAIADAHAQALLGGGVTIHIDDDGAQAAWDEIAEHNDFGAWLQTVSTVSGVYGSAGVKSFMYDDGTRAKAIEFDVQPPDAMHFIHDGGSAGRSVKRFDGVLIITGYNTDTGMTLPYPLAPDLQGVKEIKIRTEFISNDRWMVWLDDYVAEFSPHGERWMPNAEGTNPWGVTMASLYNGFETFMAFEGESDIALAVHDNETVNHVYSDLLYMFHLYTPIPVLQTEDQTLADEFKLGLGAGMKHEPGGLFYFANPNIDWGNITRTLDTAMQIMFVNAKMPSAALGMAHSFRDQSTVSGVAKEYEWKPTVQHAEAKRPAFARGIKNTVRKALLLRGTSFSTGEDTQMGQGDARINTERLDDLKITVDFGDDIIPTSKQEEMERLQGEMLMGITSAVAAMKQYHDWDDDRIAQELDMIAALNRAHMVEAGHGAIIDAVREKERVTLTSDDERTLFEAQAPMAADALAVDDTESEQDDEG